jgi:hypothetical protein
VAYFVVGIAILWIVWILGMRNPGLRANLFLGFDEYDKSKLQGLKDFAGVTDFYVNETEGLIIIKYDNEHTSEDDIKAFLHKEGAKI